MAASETVAMNQKSKDLQAQGIDIINLSVGEPDFNTPDHIKEALKKAVDDNYSFYPPVAGFPALRKAIVGKFKTENDLDYDPEQVVVCSGAKHCIVNVLLSIVDPGDEVIIPAPYWVSYVEQVKLCGGTNIILNTKLENDFKITPDQLEKAITPKTKVFLICSPSNPTGALYNREELEGLAKILSKHEQIIVISDEIYEHINFSGKHETIGQFDWLKDRTVVVNGVSKVYAMTGYRIGYLAAPLWITKAVIKLQGQFTSGATSAAQIAAVTALTSDQSSTKKMNAAFKMRRDYVLGRIAKMKNVKCSVPQGAFYVFPDMSAYYGKSYDGNIIKNSPDLCMYLLEKGYIATVPGSAFGEDKCIRISYATSDENLVKAMDRLEKALLQLTD
jgi:aspartate aminotransferase